MHGQFPRHCWPKQRTREYRSGTCGAPGGRPAKPQYSLFASVARLRRGGGDEHALRSGNRRQLCYLQIRKTKWFCGLSPDVLSAFSAASHPGTYPGGALLFVEGQVPRGALVLCSGKVKLSTTSRDGKVLILRVAEAGDVLGLSAAISGSPYEVTAETAGPCHVNFIEREALLRLMEKTGEMAFHAAQALSAEFQSTYRDIHELVLARSSAGKLARLFSRGARTGRKKSQAGKFGFAR